MLLNSIFWDKFLENGIKLPFKLCNDHFTWFTSHGLDEVGTLFLKYLLIIILIVRTIILVKNHKGYDKSTIVKKLTKTYVIIFTIFYPILIVLPACMLVAPFTTPLARGVAIFLWVVALFYAIAKDGAIRTKHYQSDAVKRV